MTIEFTKELVEQYEVVRESGATNMFDYRRVVEIADRADFYSLASLTRTEYYELLSRYSELIEKYDIKQ